MAINISSRISALFDAQINNVLLKSADAIANNARNIAPTQRIKANIKISPIEDTPEGKRIQVYVPLKDAPEARAYELGSGIHSTSDMVSDKQQGPHGKINIDAKNVPNLVFFWQKEDRWFVGPHVNHPGVEAKPYLAPAVDKDRKSFRGRLNIAILKILNAAVRIGFRNE